MLVDYLKPNIHLLNTKEFGASRVVFLYAKKLRLDCILNKKKATWRDVVFKAIVENVVYPYAFFNKSDLDNGLNGHASDVWVEMLKAQGAIEKNLADKHIRNNCAAIYPFNIGGAVAGLLTNIEGCPFAVELFNEKRDELPLYITVLMSRYNLKKLIVVGNSPNPNLTSMKHISNLEIIFDYLVEGCIYMLDVNDKGITPKQLSRLYKQRFEVKNDFIAQFEGGMFLDDNLQGCLLFKMLSYYLKWQMRMRLKKSFSRDGKEACSRSLETILERMKSIRSQTLKFEDVVIEHVLGCLDFEQIEFISSFGISVEQFNSLSRT